MTSLTDLYYKGHINTTRNGKTCKYWNTTKYSKEEQNYCRTPPGDPNNAVGPWCYTSNGWDRCNVSVCEGKTIYPNLHRSDVNPQKSEDVLELITPPGISPFTVILKRFTSLLYILLHFTLRLKLC
jgi:hypothetical protein